MMSGRSAVFTLTKVPLDLIRLAISWSQVSQSADTLATSVGKKEGYSRMNICQLMSLVYPRLILGVKQAKCLRKSNLYLTLIPNPKAFKNEWQEFQKRVKYFKICLLPICWACICLNTLGSRFLNNIPSFLIYICKLFVIFFWFFHFLKG